MPPPAAPLTTNQVQLTLTPVHFALLSILLRGDDDGTPLKKLRQVQIDGKRVPSVDELGGLMAAGMVGAIIDPLTGQPPVDEDGNTLRLYRIVQDVRTKSKALYAQHNIEYPDLSPTKPATLKNVDGKTIPV